MKYDKVINQRNHETIAESVLLADSFWLRLKGLLGKRELLSGEGLLLYPCSAIHCFGMKFAIDAIFLDEDKKVIHIEENMTPGTKAVKKKARYVLELKAGVVQEKRVEVGDVLEIEK